MILRGPETMWKGSRQSSHTMVFLLILARWGVELPLVLGASKSNCSQRCGNVLVPYPFYFQENCGSYGLGLTCTNSTLKIKLRSVDYTVLDFWPGGILIDPLPVSCNRNLEGFNLQGFPNFAISIHNILQFSDCNNATDCSLSCNFPLKVHDGQCDFNKTCCYTLLNAPEWQPGDGLKRFSHLQCKTFTSWATSNDRSSFEAEYGLRLEWGILGTCENLRCDANAHCEHTVAVKGGVRCACDEGYVGDGFAEGTGCVRVCTRHGEVAYDVDCHNQGNVKKTLLLVAGLLLLAVMIAATLTGSAFLLTQKSHGFQRKRRGDRSQLASLLPLCSDAFTLELFTYKALERATKGFSSTVKCGHGACGTVYAGELHDGRLVAVKRMHSASSDRAQQLLNEISLLSMVKHKNLVHLLGCCLEDEVPILVYEFIPNGTLAQHLQREKGQGLDWWTRITIATDTSEALAYLHSTINPPIYHRDVKSCNILLDFDFNCKVADFGLSKLGLLEGTHISTIPQGTPGYLDPDYHQTFHLSDKSDVYSFGVVLIEIITAMKALDFEREQKEVNLARLAVSRIASGCLDGILDPFLQVDQQPSVRALVQRVAELAFRCLSCDKDARPTMVEVSQELLLIKKASMPMADFAQVKFSNLHENGDTADKPAHSSISIPSIWPSNTTISSDRLT